MATTARTQKRLIHIFRAGRHTAMGGKVVELSEADVRRAARAYKPGVHEAPLVIGHPKHDDPAYGWTSGLHSRGGDLFATVDQIDPSFAESVTKGTFKKVSASFYAPDSPNNPKPGSYYLRHIGFLGAQPPAVKGLDQVEFGEGDTGYLTFEFAEFAEGDTGSEAAAAATETVDKVVSTAGAALATAVTKTVTKLLEGPLKAAFPDLDAKVLAEAISKALAAPPEGETQGSQLQMAIEEALLGSVEAPVKDAVMAAAADTSQVAAPVTLDHAESGLSQRERRVRAREQELADRERRARRSEHEAFLGGVLKEGKRLPVTRTQALSFLEHVEGGTVEFAEGQSAIDTAKKLISALPVVVNFSEFGGGEGDVGDDPQVIASKAAAYQSEQSTKGIRITTSEAVRHVSGR